MTTKFQLEFLRTLQNRKGRTIGFTLIELMIVVAILGILSVLAITRFMGARDSAEANVAVADIISQAKECGVFKASGGVGNAPTTGTPACSTTGVQVYAITWSKSMANLKCLTATPIANARKASITVEEDGSMNCLLTPS